MSETNGSNFDNESIDGFRAVYDPVEEDPWDGYKVDEQDEHPEPLEELYDQLDDLLEAHDAEAGLLVMFQRDHPFMAGRFPEREEHTEITEELWYSFTYLKAMSEAALHSPRLLVPVASYLQAGHELGGDVQLDLASRAVSLLQQAQALTGVEAVRKHPHLRIVNATHETRQLLERLEAVVESDENVEVTDLLHDLRDHLDGWIGDRSQAVDVDLDR